jgi:hypothetical protein
VCVTRLLLLLLVVVVATAPAPLLRSVVLLERLWLWLQSLRAAQLLTRLLPRSRSSPGAAAAPPSWLAPVAAARCCCGRWRGTSVARCALSRLLLLLCATMRVATITVIVVRSYVTAQRTQTEMMLWDA